MLQIISLDDAQGKVLRAVLISDEEALFVFDDQTMAVLGIKEYHDNWSSPYELEVRTSFHWAHFRRDELTKYGVITTDELETSMVERQQDVEARERAEYERLRRKFEGT